jgi:hypothetical protein
LIVEGGVRFCGVRPLRGRKKHQGEAGPSVRGFRWLNLRLSSSSSAFGRELLIVRGFRFCGVWAF